MFNEVKIEEAPDREERELLKAIESGHCRSWKQMMCGIKNPCSNREIQENCQKMFASHDIFRTCYLYRGLSMPVKVAYEDAVSQIPIIDLQAMQRAYQETVDDGIMV